MNVNSASMEGAGHPASELEQRLDVLEARVWRGLLTLRFALPAVTLASLAGGALAGVVPVLAASVWLVLAVWTASTTPWLWSRLEWARRPPAAFWVETGVLALLLCVGLGTRQWHVVHFLPLMLFCALLVTVRPTVVVVTMFVIAIWTEKVLVFVGFDLPLESSSGPMTPSVLFIVAASILLFVSTLFGDLRRLARAEGATASTIQRMRRSELKRAELLHVLREATGPIARLLDGVARDAQALHHTVDALLSTRVQRLISTCKEVEATLEELGRPADPPTDAAELVANEIERARGAGWDVRVEGQLDHDVPLDGERAAALRRLLREALANASFHGESPPTVLLGDARVEIANRAARAPRPRSGHFGLANLRADAEVLGVPLTIEHADGSARVGIDLSPLLTVRSERVSREIDELQSLLTRRLVVRERAFHIGLAVVAVLTPLAVVLTTGQAAEHPDYLVASLLFLGWAIVRALLRHPREAMLLELAAVLVLNIAQDGVSGPWLAVTFAAMAQAALYAGNVTSAAYGVALALSLVVGAALDPNAGEPLAAIIATLTLVVVYWMFATVRWAFARLTEVSDAYDAAMSVLLELERNSAVAEARADAQREIHNSLLSLILAASITHAGIARRAQLNPTHDTLGARLTSASTSVRELLDSLQGRGPAGEGA